MPAPSVPTTQHVSGRRAAHAGGLAAPACRFASRTGCRPTFAPSRSPWRCSQGHNGWVLTAAPAAAERGFAGNCAGVCPSCKCRQSCHSDSSGTLPSLRRLGRQAAAWKQRHGGACRPGQQLAQCSVEATLALGLGGGGGGSLIGHSGGGGGGGGGGGRYGKIPSAARAPAATSGSEDVILLDVAGECSV